jgi:hypothetical protein
MKVLILGGYGAFGGRLARLLAEQPVDLVIAGRSLERATAFCEQYGGRPAAIDRDGDVAAAIRAAAPDVVVDASGPFQGYGPDPYRVARASLAARAHYLDLADDAAFVAGVGVLDAQARAAGRVVLSGLSTLPALSFAAARGLSVGWDAVERLEVGIAPSPKVDFGLSVIRATASYAGGPLRLWRDGAWVTAAGLVETRRWTIGAPGGLPLRRRLFALADAPDLLLAPKAWPTLRNAWTGAAPSPGWALWCLTVLARLRSIGLLPRLTPLAGLFQAAINALNWGEHRGGMIVEAAGIGNGAPVARSWRLVAEGDDGPFIPSMAAAAVIARLAAGRPPAPGARAASAELELADFQPFFDTRAIEAGFRDEPSPSDLVFRQVLGAAFDQLPAAVAALHAGAGDETWAGAGSVERGRGPVVATACALFGFPASTPDTPVRVQIKRRPGVETWRRTFGSRSFSSVLTVGRGAREQLISERFGPVSVALALVLRDGVLDFVVRDWSVLGVPLPAALAPRSRSGEREADGRFAFDVEIGLPLVGRLVRYRGWLERA